MATQEQINICKTLYKKQGKRFRKVFKLVNDFAESIKKRTVWTSLDREAECLKHKINSLYAINDFKTIEGINEFWRTTNGRYLEIDKKGFDRDCRYIVAKIKKLKIQLLYRQTVSDPQRLTDCKALRDAPYYLKEKLQKTQFQIEIARAQEEQLQQKKIALMIELVEAQEELAK